ncbi:MAG: MCE family protein [Gordonia sp. (in: high G+C Gram-positive bacteria)]
MRSPRHSRSLRSPRHSPSLRSPRPRYLAVITGTVALLASACGFSGVNSLPVPGAEGTGNGSYQISAVIPSAAGLVNNAPVLFDDATVGSIGSIEPANWKAKVTIRLNPGVRVPRGSHVMVAMTSALGSSHLALVAPDTPGSASGYLRAGDQIPLPACPDTDNIAAPSGAAIPDITAAQQVAGCAYPTTEQVLSSLSVVLNGGGLSQIGDIVHEMHGIVDGRNQTIRRLIPRLTELMGTLDEQTGNIVRAMAGLDRLTATVTEQTPTLERALADSPKILRLLNDQRQQLIDALDAVGRLSATTNDVLDANTRDIKTIFANLRPAFKGLADAGPALPGSLRILLTFPFLEEEIPTIIKGDYVNSDLVLDLTIPKLQSSILRSVGVVGPEAVAGRPAGNAGRGLNPFTSPLTPGGATRSSDLPPVPAGSTAPNGGTR